MSRLKDSISPWSSKSTDIAHNCGLGRILRLERGIAYTVGSQDGHQFSEAELDLIAQALHDRMTEMVLKNYEDASMLFSHAEPRQGETVDVIGGGKDALLSANSVMGLALSADEIDYLVDYFTSIMRNPVDAELMMFAQANSEHCRHKIFNADWMNWDTKLNRERQLALLLAATKPSQSFQS